jgi:hypothetical protein
MEPIVNTIVTTLVTMALNALALAIFSQRLKERDESIRLLNERLRNSEAKLSDISEDRIAKIEVELAHGAQRRHSIYETIETNHTAVCKELSDNYVSRAWCKAQRDMTDSLTAKIENHISRLTAEIGESNAQAARTAAVVDLIANQLCLSLGKPHASKGTSA